jgi:hypothetical protein
MDEAVKRYSGLMARSLANIDPTERKECVAELEYDIAERIRDASRFLPPDDAIVMGVLAADDAESVGIGLAKTDAYLSRSGFVEALVPSMLALSALYCFVITTPHHSGSFRLSVFSLALSLLSPLLGVLAVAFSAVAPVAAGWALGRSRCRCWPLIVLSTFPAILLNAVASPAVRVGLQDGQSVLSIDWTAFVFAVQHAMHSWHGAVGPIGLALLLAAFGLRRGYLSLPKVVRIYD